MKFTKEQRRALIALSCELAWADGAVRTEERAFIRSLVERLTGTVLSEAELECQLMSNKANATLAELPTGVDQLFTYEAMKLLEADGDLRDSELNTLEEIINRVFVSRPAGTPLAQISLVKKAVPRD